MTSGSDFLLAARLCEIADLEQLGRTADLVAVIARFIHALQRERGISSVYLGSLGRRYATERQAQLAECAASVLEQLRTVSRSETSAARP